ncbi:MAG TPA: hypothetical protein VN851_11380 [Thermoanaerobaculia bacterium]|nr:hypothetical protein [Thermoanaerobaculia bacterium]
MKKFALFGAACALAFTIPSVASAANATVTVANQSEWEIHQFFLSPAETDKWGPDQLDENVIGKGDTFKLTNIPCDTYDVKLVDEEGDECVVEAVDICGGKGTWTITSKALVQCQAETGDDDE